MSKHPVLGGSIAHRPRESDNGDYLRDNDDNNSANDEDDEMSPPPLGTVALAVGALGLLAGDGFGLRIVVLGVGHVVCLSVSRCCGIGDESETEE